MESVKAKKKKVTEKQITHHLQKGKAYKFLDTYPTLWLVEYFNTQHETTKIMRNKKHLAGINEYKDKNVQWMYLQNWK